MGFSLCGIPVGRGYVRTLYMSGVEDSTWQGRVVDRKPTALRVWRWSKPSNVLPRLLQGRAWLPSRRILLRAEHRPRQQAFQRSAMIAITGTVRYWSRERGSGERFPWDGVRRNR